MKLQYINDVVGNAQVGDECTVTGRICSTRDFGKITFIDVTDYTGQVQVVLEGKNGHALGVGSYVEARGTYAKSRDGDPEIQAQEFTVLADSTLNLSPNPFKIDGTDETHDAQVFSYPGFYAANPQRAAVLKAKTDFVGALHRYFQDNEFTLVEPPILTDKTLYGDETSIKARVHGEDVYLSQCATFELEPLAMTFGKVYTISPAFRNEKGGSKRHLAEYTHAKAEVMLADTDDLIFLAGDSLYHAVSRMMEKSERELEMLGVEIDVEALHPDNHVRMTYDEAIPILHRKGSTIEYGSGLSRSDELLLTDHVGQKYLWVQFLPFESEGFPYSRMEGAPHLSMTCDLIAPHGAGEMVGVAEKTTDPEELIQNIIDKGLKKDIKKYWEYILLRKFGMPPHGGIGAAPERIIYGLLGLNHIKLTKPWARYPGRKINPTNNQELNPWGDPDLERMIKKFGLE